MKKKNNSKNKVPYVSKGLVPTIGKKTRRILNQFKEFNFDGLMARMAYRREVMLHSGKNRKLADRVAEKDMIDSTVNLYLMKFGASGLTRAGVIQAIKTNKLEERIQMWASRHQSWKEKQPA